MNNANDVIDLPGLLQYANTTLLWACREGYFGIATHVVEHNHADVNAEDKVTIDRCDGCDGSD